MLVEELWRRHIALAQSRSCASSRRIGGRFERVVVAHRSVRGDGLGAACVTESSGCVEAAAIGCPEVRADLMSASWMRRSVGRDLVEIEHQVVGVAHIVVRACGEGDGVSKEGRNAGDAVLSDASCRPNGSDSLSRKSR